MTNKLLSIVAVSLIVGCKDVDSTKTKTNTDVEVFNSHNFPVLVTPDPPCDVTVTVQEHAEIVPVADPFTFLPYLFYTTTPALDKEYLPKIQYLVPYNNTIVEAEYEANDNKDWYSIMIKGVKFFEGYKAYKYHCSGGVATIGYGCTIPKIVKKGYVTEQFALQMLEDEIQDAREQVERYVTVELTDNELWALTSFTFNCGPSNLKLLVDQPNRLNDGNYESVEKYLPMYRLASGKVRRGLVKRRDWELNLWLGKDIDYR
ncbi:lysozyme [bacterium]|nr:lysozyme [bacterium]